MKLRDLTNTEINLANHAVLVKVTCKCPTMSVKNKAASEEYARQVGGDPKNFSLTKKLTSIPPFKRLSQLKGQINNTTKRRETAPWTHDGEFVLPVDLIEEFTTNFYTKHRSWEENKAELANSWPALIEAARQDLGSDFDINQYPTEGEWRSWVEEKFVLTETTRFMEGADDDIRNRIPKERLEKMLEAERQQAAKAIEQVTGSVIDRIVNALTALSNGMDRFGVKEEGSSKIQTFQQSTLDAVEDLLEVLPHLNITNDPAIAAATQKMTDYFKSGFDAAELKKSESDRKEVSEKAKDVVNELTGMYS